MAPGPIEERIRCVGISTKTWGRSQPGQCEVDADKEGLCWLHWRDIYGHAVDMYHTTRCDVCGETDSNVLRHWDAPCAGKTENPEWRTQLQEIRGRERALWQQEKLLEKAERAEREALLRPARYKKKPLPPPSPHDAFSRKEFLKLSGITSARLNKLLQEGQVDGVSISGRMFFSRRQLERLLEN